MLEREESATVYSAGFRSFSAAALPLVLSIIQPPPLLLLTNAYAVLLLLWCCINCMRFSI
jgi:hypothetical protein